MSHWKTYASALPLAANLQGAPPKAPTAPPPLRERVDAIVDWAGDAPILAVLEIELAETTLDDQARSQAHTEVVLHVLEVVRDDLGDSLSEGERLWMEIPGGAIGQDLWISGAAPLLFEGDTVLARLDLGDDGPRFTGLGDVLPMVDDAVLVCVDPDPLAAMACEDLGAGLLPGRGDLDNPRADLAPETHIDDLFLDLQ